MTTTAAPAGMRTAWDLDMARYDKVLAPFAFQVDGDWYLSPEAPTEHARLYGQLVSIGYANGWL